MIPKLGLTAENIKSFEEAKSDDAGIRNELYKPTWIEIKVHSYTILLLKPELNDS